MVDIAQTKLTKLEWESIEIPVSQDEEEILKLICNGFNDVSKTYNKTLSLFGTLKVENSENIDKYLFYQYLFDKLKNPNKIIQIDIPEFNSKKINIKKATSMKIKNSEHFLESKELIIYEFVILDVINKFALAIQKKDLSSTMYFYTIHNLFNINITNKNHVFMDYCEKLLNKYESGIQQLQIIENGYNIIERNNYLLKYGDIKLFDHQKKIFSLFNNEEAEFRSSLTLYIAPTGTGKTLTPLGLSEKYRIIFICAARHVGLALGKAAISVRKKIALAFNCVDSSGIRLHNFAGSSFVRRDDGKIIKYKDGTRKTDHTVGDKVDIMICDVKSYIPAMYYMMSCNDRNNIITYWDEPTITMDNEEHELHSMIHNNWKNNLIPKMVLSSATLPKQEEIHETIRDFKIKFEEAEIYSIVSHDCQKSIPIVNSECYTCLPHFLWENYSDLMRSVEHCCKNKTLLRYFDLQEIINFIMYVNKNSTMLDNLPDIYKADNYFESIHDINMKSIKCYYLDILQNIPPTIWSTVYTHFKELKKKNYESNAKMVTADSYTLTDGPSIFLAEDVNKVGKVCIKLANIPKKVMDDLNDAIAYNNKINIELTKLEQQIEDMKNKMNLDEDTKKAERMSNTELSSSNMKTLQVKVDSLRSMIKVIELNDLFIPNRTAHLNKWAEGKKYNNPFTCNIGEHNVIKIMELQNVDDSWKILLLMGIGVFTEHKSIDYTEVMKELAREQKLFMIIASSNYIYGTNYQFCHGYIGKDMSENMTQEKCIQAMGRVGRNKIQQTYSVRFRDDDLIKRLLLPEENKIEVRIMNRLFNSEED